MQELSVILSLITGLLLRFGIPIGITALLVYALRRLDQKWQREVELEAQSAFGQVNVFEKIRCWVSKECSQGDRDSCPAFLQNNRPCWQVFRDESGEMRGDCLNCPVFLNTPVTFPA
jgi:hypothetical protein